ncbi:hypothetical protein RJ640_023804 [Escallonia rubra]|uniref:Ty3 transposon capsid-like protein domain-containing protein n=1 Tax=Escallonia rubra TaxID=112253 RepID=A0AA88QS58_9ASTE|nr:hypothetical protein RJ640_023804 [Escallonia rubra]
MISRINTQLDNVTNEKEHGEASHNHRQRSDANTESRGGSSGTYLPKMVKLDFPKFNGDEVPTSWVFYQLIKGEQGVISWPTFKEELRVRYGRTQFQDFFGDLMKLQQSDDAVKQYQTQFDKHLIRVGKLYQEQQVGYFISGLKENLKVDLKAYKPTSLSSATSLACLMKLEILIPDGAQLWRQIMLLVSLQGRIALTCLPNDYRLQNSVKVSNRLRKYRQQAERTKYGGGCFIKRQEYRGESFAVSSPVSQWLESIKEEIEKSPIMLEIMKGCKLGRPWDHGISKMESCF